MSLQIGTLQIRIRSYGFFYLLRVVGENDRIGQKWNSVISELPKLTLLAMLDN